ncbi:MAG: response regulator [Nevskia sp.]|nr:response regulator [Nevskia sp.]
MKAILIVDDEIATAEALALILEDEGYRVARASNGLQGLQRAVEIKPDLVILDFMMPLMSGAEMAAKLRAAEATRDIKIVMNSALGEQAVREHFTDYDAFLRKPYTIDKVLGAIHSLLHA